jgi:hypothetical protein
MELGIGTADFLARESFDFFDTDSDLLSSNFYLLTNGGF